MEDLLLSIFQFNGKFDSKEWFNLDDIKSKSSPIGEYLYKHFNDVYEFYSSSKVKLQYNEKNVDIAAITIVDGFPVVYLNPHRITYIFKEFDVITAYKLIAGILYHEMLHYIFKHFRLPPQQYETNTLNYAQDIVIDNYIKTKIHQWRDWGKFIEVINDKVKENKIGLSYISLKQQEELTEEYKSIFELSDKDLYVYLRQTGIEIKEVRLDIHTWAGHLPSNHQGQFPAKVASYQTAEENQSQKEGENYSEKSPDTAQQKSKTNGQTLQEIAEDFYDEFISSMKKKYDEIKNDFFLSNSQDRTLEKLYKRIDETNRYELFNILRRYVKKISAKRKQRTWKKINKRYPYLFPGNINKKNPGQVFLILDVSGSMHTFLEKYLVKIFSDIYYTFKKVSKLYGDIEKIYRADLDSEVRSFDEIKSIDELKEFKYHIGDQTDYSKIFTEYLFNWQKITKSTEKYPDLIIFITDFDPGAKESIKSIRNKYPNMISELSKRILWLYTGSGEPEFNPGFGTVINVFSFFRLKEGI